MDKETFYLECIRILGTGEYLNINHHNRRSNRWGPRQPGNGRFDNFGIIRYFSSSLIHISCPAPLLINQTFTSPESAITFIKAVVDASK